MADQHSCRRRSAFSLIELLVVIFIVGFLIALMLPALCRSSEQGNRVKCASNLRQIGLAIQMYANDNGGCLPRGIFNASDNPVPTAFTGAKAATPFGLGGPAANDVSAALYLVMWSQDLTSEVFVCPSSSAERLDKPVQGGSNWASADSLSYSYNNPYPSKAWRDSARSETSAQAKHDGVCLGSLPPDLALAADMNPGGPVLTTMAWNAPRGVQIKANTRNHNGDGQNVLYGDGHVEFQTSVFAGVARKDAAGGSVRDNIYVSGGPLTNAPAVINAAPVDLADSVLLPTADPSTAPSPVTVSMNTREFGARRIVWLSSGAVMLGACGAGGTAIRLKRRRRKGEALMSSERGSS